MGRYLLEALVALLIIGKVLTLPDRIKDNISAWVRWNKPPLGFSKNNLDEV
jgi:hypothetical protein